MEVTKKEREGLNKDSKRPAITEQLMKGYEVPSDLTGQEDHGRSWKSYTSASTNELIQPKFHEESSCLATLAISSATGIHSAADVPGVSVCAVG